MSRAARLLNLLEILRQHRHPVTADKLASVMDVSVRTLYRDIASLQQQGARIEGEPGMGYVLRPGFTLPPLMFTQEEVEALVLGSRWVADRADSRLADSARQALSKIASVLPSDLRHDLESAALLIGPGEQVTSPDADLALMRLSIRAEKKLHFQYQDQHGAKTSRTVWPFALAFFDRVRVMVAWCELRQSFRHFRADRMSSLQMDEHSYPRRRQVMLKEWRAIEGVKSPDKN
jgi:predicted DNA-binding transcriptional regulator YafY